MLIYLLKSTCILGLLLLFYRLVLEKEAIHNFKRFYLLGAVFAAVVIPAVSITSYVEAVAQPIQHMGDGVFLMNESKGYTEMITTVCWSIYAMGVLIFGFRFIKNLCDLYLKIKRGQKIRSSRYIYVLINQLITPHTFLHYIFFERSRYKNQKIPKALKVHEETHASQLHSADILFIEFLLVVFWFNPLLYILKKYVQLNHEFIADHAVLNADVQVENYQELILQYTTHSKYAFANAINYSSIKKRFTIMKTKTPPKVLWIKFGFLALFVALLTLGFSTKKEVELETPTEIESTITKDKLLKQDIRQDKATPQQVAEYNRLAKYYNEQEPDKMIVKLKDVEKMKYIYGKMTASQKKAAQPFPELPPPPPPAPKKNWANQGSKKLQEFAKLFFDKTDNYLINFKQYNAGKKEYKTLKTSYEASMLAYERYAKKAEEENIVIPPPPPPIPEEKQTSRYKKNHQENNIRIDQSILKELPENPKYYVNGKLTTRAKVLLLDVDRIESIHVKKKEGTNGSVHITLK